MSAPEPPEKVLADAMGACAIEWNEEPPIIEAQFVLAALHRAGYRIVPESPAPSFVMSGRERAVAAIAVILDEGEHFAVLDRLNRPSVAEETLDRLTTDLPIHAAALGAYLGAVPESEVGLDALRALSDAATPGPWCDDYLYEPGDRLGFGTIFAAERWSPDAPWLYDVRGATAADSAFVVAAVNYVRARLSDPSR